MNPEYIKELLSVERLRPEYKKPFQFGDCVLATNGYIMVISGSKPERCEYGDPAALGKAEQMLQSLPSAKCSAAFDIKLLKQAIEIFDSHHIAYMNLYDMGDGLHYIEIASIRDEAVLLCGMRPGLGAPKPPMTIAERFALVNPTFNDCGAGI